MENMNDFDRKLLVGLKRRIVKYFGADDWDEVGLLTGCDDFIDSHPRLKSGAFFGNTDYPVHVIPVLKQMAEKDTGNLKIIENYLNEKYPDDESLLESAKHLEVASQQEASEGPSCWSPTDVRLFISHLAENREETEALRDQLAYYGIIAFVAHKDIEPTKDWQAVIESSLSVMDGLVALLAPGTKESNWCDQEIGVAIGRKIPIIAVRQGLDPYGFIGKYQALQGDGKDPSQIAEELFNLLLHMPVIGLKITDVLVTKLAKAASFEESGRLAGLIEKLQFLNSKHVVLMKEALDKNGQVSGSWGVTRKIEDIIRQIES